MKILKALYVSFGTTPLVCKTGDQQMAVKAKFHLLAFKALCKWDCATKLCQNWCSYAFGNRFRFAKPLEKRSFDFCPLAWECVLGFQSLCLGSAWTFIYLFWLRLWLFCKECAGDCVVSVVFSHSVQEYFLIPHVWEESFYAWWVCLTMGYVLGCWFYLCKNVFLQIQRLMLTDKNICIHF